MQIYLVGGAIRDRLLELPAPYECDWVVVGSSIVNIIKNNLHDWDEIFGEIDLFTKDLKKVITK